MLSARDISIIEKNHPEGLSSKQILEVFDAHGERMSEATLRKYVQLGLLPRSRRVGEKGKHRGSRGIYPVDVIRRVDEIRRAMTDGETLEDLAKAAQAIRAKLSSVRVNMEEVLQAAERDLAHRNLDRKARSELKAMLGALEKDAKGWLRTMERWTTRVQQSEQRSSRSSWQAATPANTNTNRKKGRAKQVAKSSRRRGGV